MTITEARRLIGMGEGAVQPQKDGESDIEWAVRFALERADFRPGDCLWESYEDEIIRAENILKEFLRARTLTGGDDE